LQRKKDASQKLFLVKKKRICRKKTSPLILTGFEKEKRANSQNGLRKKTNKKIPPVSI
jgi:hypothetical protein